MAKKEALYKQTALDEAANSIKFMAWLRERRLRKGSSTSPAGTLVADKADAGEACPVAVVAGEGLDWD